MINDVVETEMIVYSDGAMGIVEKIEADEKRVEALFIGDGEESQAIIDKVKEDVAGAFDDFDIEKKKDRDEWKRKAKVIGKVARFADNVGKTFKEKLSVDVSKIDPRRKQLREEIFKIEEEALSKVVEWENAKKKRDEEVKNTLEDILLRCSEDEMSLLNDEGLKASISAIDAVEITDDMGSLKDSIELQKMKALSTMKAEVEARELATKEALELKKKEELEAAENAKIEAERLRKEGEARAIALAEAEAKKQAEKVEEDKMLAKEREDKAVQDAKDAELKAIELAKKAESDKLASEKLAKENAKLAEEKRIKDIEDAKNAEIKRQADEAKKIEDENKKREANTTHSKKVNNNIVKDLMKIKGVNEELAKSITIALAKKQIFQTVINY